MEPTLCDGDFILLNSKSQVKVGSVVVATHPHSGTEIVKRVQSIGPTGIWLLSDNPEEGSDSRRFGAVNKASLSGVVSLILNRPVNSL